MGIPEKRQLGAHATWIGFDIYGALGTVAIPRPKRVRAMRDLNLIVERRAISHGELNALLEHLLPWCGMCRDSFDALRRVYKRCSAHETNDMDTFDDDAVQLSSLLDWKTTSISPAEEYPTKPAQVRACAYS